MLRTALLASVAGAAALTVPTFAAAQSSEEVAVGEIVVTGSRIRRPDLTSVQPLQVITTQSMEKRGFTNVADALNDLPSSGVPISPVGDQGSFGVGRNFINIFNLGTNRTLTLVNGRRFVGGNPASIFTGAAAGGQVDLNVIPTGLVERIETIQAGGSAVYGSDAIAGVINVITRTDFEGVEIDGQYGISDRSDAEEYRGRITVGQRFLDDRLSLSGSYEYNETSALGYNDRARTREQMLFAVNPANVNGTDGIPGSVPIFNRRIPEVTLGGLPYRANAAGTAIAGTASSNVIRLPDGSLAQFGPGGALIPYNFGTFYSASVASGGDGLNLGDLSSLLSPVKRHVATAFAKYDLTDNIRINGEFFYSEFSAVEPYNQPIYNAPLFGGNSAALRMSTANPFLPAASRAILLSQTTPLPADPANPGERIFFLSRASVDIGNNKTEADGDTWRGVLAIDGDLNFLDRDFFWSASFTQGQATGSFTSPNIVQSRFLQAIDVIRDGSGAIVCRDPAARAAGCAPLNLFGQGSPSQAALDYVGVQFESEYNILQTVYEANFGGDLLQLPGGMWSFAAGVEARYEKSDFNPNEPQELGVGRSAAITALTGKFDTKEWYAETLVPIFGDEFSFPMLHRLEVEAAYRKVDHSQAGKDDAWSYGGRWFPIQDLMIRGQKSRSFRAPAITELFLPNATSFMTATDPCDFRNINSGPNPATRAANCRAAFQALGLPANFNLTSQVQAATVQGSQAGNPALENEIAKQWTLGFVYQPSFVPGLAISFDWANIKLKGAISNFNLTSILQVCYDSPNPPADACGRFQRGNSNTDATTGQGQILTNGAATGTGATATGPSTGYINAGYLNFEGFTAGIDYRTDLADVLGGAMGGWFGGDPGRLEFNFDLYHVERQETSVTGLGFDLNRDQGEIGNAKWRWKLETNYDRGPLSVNWTINWFDESQFNNDFTLETRYPLRVDDYFLHDVGVTYDLADWTKRWGVGLDNLRARLVVRNVFDEEPPIYATGSANAYGSYDFLGRYYVLGLTARF
ncbi:TonB-dependent receptor [Phenylobacterium sp. J426]|uniref:TonB-dependent receptor domain-containing protein n=1 Tax=Phenylobacterium sp. J426 TaxID=2898439 RepID=UPI002151313A|nr:TonB-dependent receptor [Phenylobacterium sp. J426]MCR5874708.1 TonB-dependent receptor [Phenylobacterium sp. J426]